MKDNWCSALISNGQKISGGAARNVRIKNAGGMDEILKKSLEVGLKAGLENALKMMEIFKYYK